MTWLLAGILFYVLIQIGIGWWVSRRIETESDYLLAGRKLGYALGTFTIFATWFGAESVIGSSGAIYGGGLAGGSVVAHELVARVIATRSPKVARRSSIAAGIFTIVVFGLFTKLGGKSAAAFTLLIAMSVWLTATFVFDLPWSYLLSLICAISTYLIVSIFEKRSS